MKTLRIIQASTYSEVATTTTVKCRDYEILPPSLLRSYTELRVTRPNGNIDSWILMTEIHEVVWKRSS